MCTHTHVCVCVYIHACICVCIYLCVYICVGTYMCVYMYVYVCMCLYLCMCVYIPFVSTFYVHRTHIQVYRYFYASMYIYILTMHIYCVLVYLYVYEYVPFSCGAFLPHFWSIRESWGRGGQSGTGLKKDQGRRWLGAGSGESGDFPLEDAPVRTGAFLAGGGLWVGVFSRKMRGESGSFRRHSPTCSDSGTKWVWSGHFYSWVTCKSSVFLRGNCLFWKFVVSHILRLKMKDILWVVVWGKCEGSRSSWVTE